MSLNLVNLRGIKINYSCRIFSCNFNWPSSVNCNTKMGKWYQRRQYYRVWVCCIINTQCFELWISCYLSVACRNSLCTNTTILPCFSNRFKKLLFKCAEGMLFVTPKIPHALPQYLPSSSIALYSAYTIEFMPWCVCCTIIHDR